MKMGQAFVRFAAIAMTALLWCAGWWFWRVSADSFFNRNPDPLPANIELPKGVDVSDVGPSRSCDLMWKDSSECDDFTRTLFRASCQTSSPSLVRCDISSLDRLAAEDRELLLWYLAASPSWSLRNGGDGLVASRRVRWLDGSWHDVSSVCFGPPEEDLVIVRPYVWIDFGTTNDLICRTCDSGMSVSFPSVAPVDEYEERELSLVCRGKSLSLGLTEMGPPGPSRLFQTIFDEVEREFSQLTEAGAWDKARSLLSQGAVRRGNSELTLFNHIGRCYRYEAWLNPGEKGSVNLKAFEVSRNIPLRVNDGGARDMECVGWSDDPEEKFYIGGCAFLGSYSENKDFAARFEVWFTPANGGSERKLAEHVYRIKGKEVL